MKVAVMQSNYIPWKGYFDMINMVDAFVLYDTVQYTKNDWRNRNKIMTRTGSEWLTVPVRVQSLQQPINEIAVANPKWNRKHWASITTNYSKAEFFGAYKEKFEGLYSTLTMPLLSEINFALISTICDVLSISTNMLKSEDFDLSGDRNDRLLQICAALGADTYISGPAAQFYLDVPRFNAAGVAVEWMDYSGYKAYQQLSDTFEHGVTVLDLLFNEGPRAGDYLLS